MAQECGRSTVVATVVTLNSLSVSNGYNPSHINLLPISQNQCYIKNQCIFLHHRIKIFHMTQSGSKHTGDGGDETELRSWYASLAKLMKYIAIALTVFHLLVLVGGVLIFDSALAIVLGLSVVFFFTLPTMLFAWIGYGIYAFVYENGPGYIPIRRV